MPLRQYMIFKRASEIEHLSDRINNILDISYAFNGPQKLIDDLNKRRNELISGDSKKNNINWKSDSNWQSKLLRYKQ